MQKTEIVKHNQKTNRDRYFKRRGNNADSAVVIFSTAFETAVSFWSKTKEVM